LLPLVLVPVFVLSACGENDDGEASAADSRDDAALQEAIEVSGEDEPKVEVVDKDYTVDGSQSALVSEGDGAGTSEGSTIVVDYVGVNAKDGKTFDSSYQTGRSQTFRLDDTQLNPDLVSALVDRNVGDRVAMAFAAEDIVGPQGNEQIGIAPEDTLVFVFDIAQASDPDPLAEVEGESKSLPADLPQLALDDDGTPTGFTADTQTAAAPDSVRTETLIEGDGETAEAGDLLTVHYLGQVYPDGKVFDQSYQRGEPTTFQIGVGSLIKAWDSELVGQSKGSRVVIEVPPAQGYGDQGTPDGSIKPGDSLMFVVDILGVG
jgi:peptidylprolyl isomerase